MSKEMHQTKYSASLFFYAGINSRKAASLILLNHLQRRGLGNSN